MEVNDLLIKQFQEHNITIYGTFEKPLFKAKDIGDLIGIKNIRDTIKDYNKKQKEVVLIYTPGGNQETTFLTEQGLYKVLMKSRKLLAEKFQDWVCEVIEEIRKTGEYKSNREIEYKTKNNLLIEHYQNKPILYLGMVEEKTEEQIVKYGYTSHIKDTLKRHKESYGENFYLTYAIECKEHYNLENKIQNHNDLISRHVKSYNGKDRQELLRLDNNFNIKDLINLIGKIKEIIDNDREIILEEIALEKEKEKTKQIQIQAQEKTKQLELELEIMKLQISQQKFQEIQQPTIQEIKTIQEITTIKSKKPKQDELELVRKFLRQSTEFSTKTSDYIFIEDLFNVFEEWNKFDFKISIGKSSFSKIIANLENYNVVRKATGPRFNNVTPRKVAVVNIKWKLIYV